VGSLRRLDLYRAFRKATQKAARRQDFRIVHISLQRTHVHLIVEADDRQALSRGMQGFEVSAAKHVNRAFGRRPHGALRRGAVFSDRYYAEIITSPRQARHTLSYVLNNWRKHREDGNAHRVGWRIDWFSSACAFDGWAEATSDPRVLRAPPNYEPLHVTSPKTWLLNRGWKLHGETISRLEVPSNRRSGVRADG
jgi:REP element-mobilizing transposase RayT